MTTATLHASNLTPKQPSDVGIAVHELGAAIHKLASALWSAATQQFTMTQHVLTVFEEAEQVRAFADALPKADREFAKDLYAAADRHELKAR